MAASKQTALANELEKEINAGAFGWEGGLPSLQELAQRQNMSVNTVKAALALLEGRGIIEKRGGGYSVNKIPTAMTMYVAPAHTRRKDGYVRNIGPVKRVSAPKQLTDKLHISQKEVSYRVQVSGEVAEGNEKPFQLTYRYHLLPVTDEDMQRMDNDATYDVMWHGSSVPVELLSHDEVSSRLATEGERDLLNLPEETPIVHVFESISDRNGNILMAQDVILSPRATLIFDFPFTNRP